MRGMTPPSAGERKADPNGYCTLWFCDWHHRVAPSIADCVASRSLAERIRAAHQILVGSK